MLKKKSTLMLGGLLFIELAYELGTHWVAQEIGRTALSEVLRSALRLAAALALVTLLRPLIFSKTSVPAVWRSLSFGLGLFFFVLTPLTLVTLHLPNPMQGLFMATSIFVGLHEEFLFRGIVQNWIQQKTGPLFAVLVTSALFCLFHVGLVPLNSLRYLEIGLSSIVLGLLYLTSGSIWVAVWAHTLFDVLHALYESATAAQWVQTELWLVLTVVVCGFAYSRRPLTPPTAY